jgi:endogenous inhibitor of DNA gyrase (YacG/DUF329 family)
MNVLRNAVCENCGGKIARKRDGRIRRYCSDRCRQQAFRYAKTGQAYPSSQALRNDGNTPASSMPSEGHFGGRGSRFKAPRDLLGHACFQFHGPRLEPAVARAIADREIRWRPPS